MDSRVFLDANILLDYFLHRGSYLYCRYLFRFIVQGRVQAFISPSVIHIVAYWLRKTRGKASTRETIQTLLQDVKVLGMDHDIALRAVYSGMGDVEDALQYYTALHHKTDIFISQDRQLKKIGIGQLAGLKYRRFPSTGIQRLPYP